MTQKVSLTSQMAALQAAVDGKQFPARSGAERLQQEHLTAALATLRWVKTHENDFRTFMAEKKGGKA